jgi:hypothetical protein
VFSAGVVIPDFVAAWERIGSENTVLLSAVEAKERLNRFLKFHFFTDRTQI